MSTNERFRAWTAAAAQPAILRRSVATCLIVGALLTLINQGDALSRGQFDSVIAFKVGLTFLVPLVVATISGAAALESHMRRDHDDGRAQGLAGDDDPQAGHPADRGA